jgi:hypothetical protein
VILGALVLVEVTAGITKASMTRSPLSLCTRIRQRPPPSCRSSWWGSRCRYCARAVEQFVVGLDMGCPADFLPDNRLQHGAAKLAGAWSPRNRPRMSGSGTQEAYGLAGRGSAYWGSAEAACMVPNRRPCPIRDIQQR